MSSAVNAFSLKLLGGCSLSSSAGLVTGRATQRRRLAVLSIIAAAGKDGVSRERITALVWPESDAEQARHSLTDTLYVLRSALGEDVLIAAGDHVAINTEVIQCDLVEFVVALQRNDLEAAAALYAGPFLDGFHISDAPEFERWIDSERDRVEAAFASCVETLARQAQDNGEPTRAVSYWQRLATLRPYDSRVARNAAHARELAGDRAGAIQQLESHIALLRHELELNPDDDVLELLHRLRSVSPSLPPSFHLPAPLPQLDSMLPRGKGSARYVWAALAVVALVSGGWLAVRRTTNEDANGMTRVAVLPFEVQAPPGLDYLEEGMVHLLARKFEGLDDMRAVNPRTLLANRDKKIDAELIVGGSITKVGEQLELFASLRTRDGKQIAEAQARGSEDKLLEMTDELARLLLVGRYRGPAAQMQRLGASTTMVFPALRAYLDAERNLSSGRVQDAVEAFERAIELDTTFALAHARLATTLSNYPNADSRIAPALLHSRFKRHATRLPVLDRELYEAWVAWARGDWSRGEERLRVVLSQRPDLVEAWYALGDGLYHVNPFYGRSIVEARDAFEHAVNLDPGNWAATVHLAQIALFRRDMNEYERLMQRAIGSDTAGVIAHESRLVAAALHGNEHKLQSLIRQFGNDARVLRNATTSMMVLREVEKARVFAHALLRAPTGAAPAHNLLAAMAVAERRWDEATVHLKTLDEISPDGSWSRWSRFAIWPDLAVPAADVRRIRELVETAKVPDDFAAERQYRLGLLDVRLGDFAAARSRVAELENLANRAAASRDTSQIDIVKKPEYQANVIRAAIALASNDAKTAIAILDRPIMAAKLALPRYLYAMALERAGRKSEAARWYASFDMHEPIWGDYLITPAYSRAR